MPTSWLMPRLCMTVNLSGGSLHVTPSGARVIVVYNACGARISLNKSNLFRRSRVC